MTSNSVFQPCWSRCNSKKNKKTRSLYTEKEKQRAVDK